MKLSLSKNILNEISIGCDKLAVNLLIENIDKKLKYANENDKKELEIKKSNIFKNIGINKSPMIDRPSNKQYIKRGEIAEIKKIEEIVSIDSNNVITGYKSEYKKDDKSNIEQKFEQYIKKGFQVKKDKDGLFHYYFYINNKNIKNFKNECISYIEALDYDENNINKYYNNEAFDVDEYNRIKSYNLELDLKVLSKQKIKEILNINNILYQLRIDLEDGYMQYLSKKYEGIDNRIIDYFTFNYFILDFVRVLPENTKCKVFDENGNITEPSEQKLKLQVCDVKTSKDVNKYSLEICIYMLALNHYIHKMGLQNTVEVSATGLILKDNSYWNDKKNKILNFDDIKQKEIKFEFYDSEIRKVFEEDLLRFYKTLNEKTNNYNELVITSKCKLCGYYGGQILKEDSKVAETIIKEIVDEKCGKSNVTDEEKKRIKDEVKENLVQEFDNYCDRHNKELGFCRYILKNKDNNDINKIHILNENSKKLLLNNDINSIEELEKCLDDNSHITKENKDILSKERKIRALINLHKSNSTNKRKNGYKYKGRNTTNNIPNNDSELNIFIDIQKDASDNYFNLSFKSFINKEDNKLYENNKVYAYNKDTGYYEYKYINILTNNDINYVRKNFIEFLIEINKNIMQTEEIYKKSDKEKIHYCIMYWGSECLNNLKELFINVFEYIIGSKNIKDLGYTDGEINYIKESIVNVKKRFGVMFEIDDELQDDSFVEKSPFFNLKQALKDTVVINDYADENLISYSRCILNNNNIDKAKRAHIPDSDNINGYVISRIFSKYYNYYLRTNQEEIIKEYKDLVDTRIETMIKLYIDLKTNKEIDGVRISPEIKELTEKNDFKDNPIIQDMYYYNLLDSIFEMLDIQNTMNMEINDKNIKGKCLRLINIILKDDKNQDYCGDEKNEQLILEKKYPGRNLKYDKKIFREYSIDEHSLISNIDENSMNLTVYPSNKNDCIYKKFKKSNVDLYEKQHIIYNAQNENIKNYQTKCFDDDMRYNYLHKTNQNIEKKYTDVIRVNIEAIDTINKTILISYDRCMKHLISYLEEIGFDFSKDLVIEKYYNDIKREESKKLFRLKDKNNKPICDKEYIVEKINLMDENKIKSIYEICKNLDDSQKMAVLNSLKYRFNLIWGPPGTGKSTTITNMLRVIYDMEYPEHKVNKEGLKVLIMGNYNAVDNIIDSIIKNNYLLNKTDVNLIRIRSNYKDFPDEYKNINNIIDITNVKDNIEPISKNENKDFQIYTSTNHQIHKAKKLLEFDYIIIDEASQLSFIDFIPAINVSNKNTHFIIAGDDKQLAFISKVPSRYFKKQYLNSVYDYYKSMNMSTYRISGNFPRVGKLYINNSKKINKLNKLRKNIKISKLLRNRRSNQVIVEFCRNTFGYDKDYKAECRNANLKIAFENSKLNADSLNKFILEENTPIVLIEHNEKLSTMQNNMESEIIVKAVVDIWNNKLLNNKTNKTDKIYDIKDFFNKGVGIVVPYRAQRRYIINKLVEQFRSILKGKYAESDIIKACELSTNTVDKFQGQERDIIFCSYTVSDLDKIKSQEEFIYDARRLNVAISRAKAKAIIIHSKNLMNYISENEDIEEMQDYFRKLKYYCDDNIEKYNYNYEGNCYLLECRSKFCKEN